MFDVHPIMVHFPIALLTVYALMELLRFRKLTSQAYWFYVKALFAIIGSLATTAALFTGNLAKSNFVPGPQASLVHLHSNFAAVSSYIFALIALLYLLAWLGKQQYHLKAPWRRIWELKLRTVNYFLGWPVIIIALIGLGCITITGALGGALVYGTNVDPVVSIVYHLFF